MVYIYLLCLTIDKGQGEYDLLVSTLEKAMAEFSFIVFVSDLVEIVHVQLKKLQEKKTIKIEKTCSNEVECIAKRFISA